jgi:predicted ATP-grasp superfamily ATP-dependent carboligase
MPDLRLVAHAPGRFPFCRLQDGAQEIVGGTLAHILQQRNFDLIIPIGGASARLVAETCPERAVIAPIDKLDMCLNKSNVMALADRLDVPHPRSWVVHSIEEVDGLPEEFPVVVKAASELAFKGVFYAHSTSERRSLARKLIAQLPVDDKHGLLLQEYVSGTGRGYFTVFDTGRPVTAFMHERLREFPPTGGASTAARAIYDERLKDYSETLLRALDWHGPAMVEFKYDAEQDQYNLIEINPKFWGSLELGLSAGINFGEIVVRLFRGDHLEYTNQYDRNAIFVWPLDGDFATIIRSGKYRYLFQILGRNVKSNLFQSIRVDLIKIVLIMRSVFIKEQKGNS